MFHVKATENGVMGFGTLENEKDVDELLDKLWEALGYDDDEEETEDIEETEETDDDIQVEEDGFPHVVSVGYAHGVENVVVMNSRDNPWGVAAALLRAAAKTWPQEEKEDERLVSALTELAYVADGNVEADD